MNLIQYPKMEVKMSYKINKVVVYLCEKFPNFAKKYLTDCDVARYYENGKLYKTHTVKDVFLELEKDA